MEHVRCNLPSQRSGVPPKKLPLKRLQSNLAIYLFGGTFLVYALYFAVTMLQPARNYLVGDEVYYVMMSYSLWDDGDLNLEDEFASESYRAFYPQLLTEREIGAHILRGWREGMYSKHGVGLPVLIVSAWGLGRQAGVSLWLVILTALLAVQLFGLMSELVAERSAVWLAWVGLIISPPLVLYAALVYTEVPAALAIVIVLRHGILRSASMRWYNQWAVLAGLLFLPWLNPRHILFVLPLAMVIGLRGYRRLAVAAIGGTALPFTYFWFLLGYVPTLGNYGNVALNRFPIGALGLWLDAEAGVLPYGPIYILAVYGLVRTIRTRNPFWPLWNGLWLPYYLFLSTYDAWSGGFNPPARMVVPLIPFFSPLVALALAEMTPRLRYIVAAVLGTSGLIVTSLLLVQPVLRYNHHLGQSHIFEYLASQTGIDLNAIWPSFINLEPSSYWQAGLIIVGATIGYGLLFARRGSHSVWNM